MGMVYERVGFVCEAVGRSMSPTRGSCGGSGQTARARGRPSDSKLFLAGWWRGRSQRKKRIRGIIFSEGWDMLGTYSIPNGWADSAPMG